MEKNLNHLVYNKIQANLDITNDLGDKKHRSLYRKCMEKDGESF